MAYLGEIKASCTIPFLNLTGKDREIEQHLPLAEEPDRNAQQFNTIKA